MARLLLVDDDPDLLTLLKTLLEERGHEVAEAFRAQEALALLGLEPRDPSRSLPDLLLLDVMMPGMDGLSMYRRLQAEERTRRLPVVFLTGKDKEERALGEESAGLIFYLKKPFSPEELFKLIRKITEPR